MGISAGGEPVINTLRARALSAEKAIASNIGNLRNKFQTGTVGIDGFYMEVRYSENTQYQRQAPVTYLEDGSYVMDHIIPDPLVIELEGEVSNIYRRPSVAAELIGRANAKLGLISRYLPQRTLAQTQRLAELALTARDIAARVEDIASTGEPLYRMLVPAEAQQSIVDSFLKLMLTLFTTDATARVETRTGVHPNMLLVAFAAPDDNTLIGALRYRATFQQLRTTAIASTEVSADFIAQNFPDPAPSVDAQTQGNQNKGTPEMVNKSMATVLDEVGLLPFKEGLFDVARKIVGSK
jgi:hypothetical protein